MTVKKISPCLIKYYLKCKGSALLALRARMFMSVYTVFFLLLLAMPGELQHPHTHRTSKKPRIHPLENGPLSIKSQLKYWLRYVSKKQLTTSSTPASYKDNKTPMITDGGFYTLGLCMGTNVGNCNVIKWKKP